LIEYYAQHYGGNEEQWIDNRYDYHNASQSKEDLDDVHHNGGQYLINLSHIL